MTDSSDSKCIFCKIAGGQDKATDILYENEELVIFKDIKPATRHHYLIVPKHHIKDPRSLNYSHLPLVERLVEAGNDFLKQQNGDINKARFGFHWPPFTSVNHLHLHVISPTSEMGFIARCVFRPNTLWFVTAEWLINRLKAMNLKS
ncbi:histidine triad nucleotide-binding protein 3-like [Mizuhopecten yessoensis]|uniref:Adenosine 5'-monophosphoramidase HINT3 n=1 Tax=Mizuhopecten yessoensis TaxID=6573 RepID=A0A210PQ30_MIZYE|nr:histidine triad nucleotide-binding protein 3-like [Mizuhopecten yessoensis]OWF38591.1 Histidine triad nucleotide-binding protein 3 [Mizuhopecten yessoensis]